MPLIKQTDELNKHIELMQTSNFVAIDTEFHREAHFVPQLCLLQIAIPNHTILIDPLSEDIDLQSFFHLLQNENIVKVFHSARQDLEIMYLLSGELPKNIFDTQIAAMACGFGEQISYSNLVEKLLGKTLTKTHRLTDWRQRPLTKNQIQYAKDDVIYLCDIYVALKKLLNKKGRANWIIDETNALLNPSLYITQPSEAWLKLKHNLTSPRQLAILQTIAAWREQRAQELNIPRRHIIKDELIVEIADKQPNTLHQLQALRSYNTTGLNHNRANRILKLIAEAKKIEPSKCPKLQANKHFAYKYNQVLDLLKFFLKLTSEQQQVTSKLIASTTDLIELYEFWDKDKQKMPPDDLEKPKLLSNWRYEVFGKQAFALLNGEAAIGLQHKKVSLRNLK